MDKLKESLEETAAKVTSLPFQNIKLTRNIIEAHKPDDSLYKNTQLEQPAIVSNEEYHISFALGINYPEMLLNT